MSLEVSNWRALGRREIVTAGKSLQIVDFGSGPNLLLLHGFPTWSFDWAPTAKSLASTTRVIAPDLLGYGFSDKPHRRSSINQQADLILALLGARKVVEIALVAHDVGVIVAQELLRRSLSGETQLRFSSVTLLNAGIVFSQYRPTRAQKLLSTPIIGRLAALRITRDSVRRGLGYVFGTRLPLTDEVFNDIWVGLSHQDGHRLADRLLHYNAERKARHGEWEAALAAHTAPLALVWGLADPVSGAHVLAAARQAYPHARVTELADVGHFPQLEAPDDVAAAILENANLGWTNR